MDKGQQAIDFINMLPHTKGEWKGQPFNLRPHQLPPIYNIFGTLDANGYRICRTYYEEIPRKNGKSEKAAAIALKLLFADDEPGAEIYGAAGDREQATIVFNVAAQMVRMRPALMKRSKIIDSQKRIIVLQNGVPTGSFYRALSSEAYTKHGFNAHGIIFDELHTQPNRDLWDVLTTSTGSRRQPLIYAITTAGFDRNSICWELHEYAEKVRDGIVDDPSFQSTIYSAPEDADWTDEKVWFACNPALDDFRSLGEMRTACRQAQERPAAENTFRRLYLNQWTRSETRWMSLENWDACSGEVNQTELVGQRCYGGLDLASTIDIAALALAFPQDDGHVKVLMHYWIPAEKMRERINRDRVPYDVWVRQGLMTATPGNVIDYTSIARHVEEAVELYSFQELAYDPWNADMFVQQIQEFARKDFCVPCRQGYKTMSPALKELEGLTMSGRLEHGGDPCLRWMCDNMVVVTDDAGNVKPSKGKSTEKIDGMVALIMAVDRVVRHPNVTSIYSERGMREL
jgi:phage terminase large subunit-like protein